MSPGWPALKLVVADVKDMPGKHLDARLEATSRGWLEAIFVGLRFSLPLVFPRWLLQCFLFERWDAR